jgi:nucleotide-binding universal stress UspA family protein
MTSLQLTTPPPASLRSIESLFPRVVFGIDFGSASLAAARWATAHIATRAHAILAHVVPPSGCLHDAENGEAARNESLRQMTPALTGGLGGFAATLDVVEARSVLRIGSPSRWLSAVANGAEASLIVLGRRADANRIRVGEPNVIERTARRTSAAILVVPEGTMNAPERIVAALDQSAFAPKVLAVAQHLARLHDVPLVTIHVLSPSIGAYERVMRTARHLLGGRRRGRAERSHAPSVLPPSTARWLLELSQSHVVPGRDRTEVVTGDPAREIAATAASIAGTVVVVGMRGADDTPPGSIGSVVRELITRAPVPVIAVNAV